METITKENYKELQKQFIEIKNKLEVYKKEQKQKRLLFINKTKYNFVIENELLIKELLIQEFWKYNLGYAECIENLIIFFKHKEIKIGINSIKKIFKDLTYKNIIKKNNKKYYV